MSFPNHLHGMARVELGRKWGKASAAKRTGRPDWPTICKRSAHTMRGQVLRHGVTYTATTARPWSIRRAVHGRINQVELVVAGAVRKCGSLRKAESAVRRGVWSDKTPQP